MEKKESPVPSRIQTHDLQKRCPALSPLCYNRHFLKKYENLTKLLTIDKQLIVFNAEARKINIFGIIDHSCITSIRRIINTFIISVKGVDTF